MLSDCPGLDSHFDRLFDLTYQNYYFTTMTPINLRLTLDEECPIDEYLADGIVDEYFTLDDGTYQVILKDVDEELLESMNPDELVEFLGFDTEFVIYTEVLD